MRTAWKTALQKSNIALICALSVALGFSLAANYYHHQSAAIAAPTKTLAMDNWRNVFVDISDRLKPSVVYITSEKMVAVNNGIPGGLDDLFNFGPFGSPRSNQEPEKQMSKASGSGVIVRSDGYILTNDHVVGGADRVTVKLTDGREFKGKVLRDPRTDLALVKIDAKDLPAAEFADSDAVKVGQWSIAIGNPFGLQNTVTVGVVGAIRRISGPDDPLPYPEVIQTDASINPGNSGGPLVDIDGKIIGINGAIYSTSGGNVGIGFAIPSKTAKFVMTQLIEKGKVVRGYLGLVPADLTPVMAGKLGAKQGALVESIDKESPAAKGGIEIKDVITSVDGKPVNSGAGLRHIVETITPDTEVKVAVVRDKKEKTLTVKLGEAPSGIENESNDSMGDKSGLTVQPLSSDLSKDLGLDDSIKGVVVRKVEPGSSADRAGVRVKDIITEIDDSPITSVASFDKAIKQLKSGETAVVVIQRGERSVILEMPID